jgi:hypothetical protein
MSRLILRQSLCNMMMMTMTMMEVVVVATPFVAAPSGMPVLANCRHDCCCV